MAQRGDGAGPASIEDVARRAGVSTATVSRSLRGLGRVAPATRERVAHAARELRYVPLPAAAQLATRRTRAIGVLVTASGRSLWPEVVAGAERVLRDAGYDLLLYLVDQPAGRRRFFELMPLRRRVDGVLLLASSVTAREQQALRLVDVPILVVGGRMTGGGSVRIDDAAAAATSARHLLDLGHRDLVLLCSSATNASSRRAARLRRSGFEGALAVHGLEGRVVGVPPGVDGAAAAVNDLLAAGSLPTGVLTAAEQLALGALRSLHRAGIDVPGQVSVVGFDDHHVAAALDLTTITSSPTSQGQSAARQLLSALGPSTGPPGEVLVPAQLTLRGTTGPPRASDN